MNSNKEDNFRDDILYEYRPFWTSHLTLPYSGSTWRMLTDSPKQGYRMDGRDSESEEWHFTFLWWRDYPNNVHNSVTCHLRKESWTGLLKFFYAVGIWEGYFSFIIPQSSGPKFGTKTVNKRLLLFRDSKWKELTFYRKGPKTTNPLLVTSTIYTHTGYPTSEESIFYFN